jgi:hypothetical protein
MDCKLVIDMGPYERMLEDLGKRLDRLERKTPAANPAALRATRGGQPWDEKEDEKLENAFCDFLSYRSGAHQRTTGAIRERLYRILGLQ